MQTNFTKEDVLKIISLMQALVEGKTLQTPNGYGGWVNVKEPTVNDLLCYYDVYRVKPKKYNLELTYDELYVITSSLSLFMISKIDKTAQKQVKSILDKIDEVNV